MSTIRVWRRTLGRVDVLDLEEYLRGVVPAEMPVSWPAEALCVQAVAARTYATQAIAAPRHADRDADVCDTAQCQVYIDSRYPTSDAAVATTDGIIWTGDGSYVSECGRADCPHCQGAGGYGGKTWAGRMCQWGARVAAENGMTWREILALFYGGSAIEPEPSPGVVEEMQVTSLDTRTGSYSRYPRPVNDTGAGVHGGANAYHPLGDNDGNIPGMLSEMKAMGLRWVKLLDTDGSSYNACRMVLEAGMMPVVRLYRERPYPGRLSDKHRAALPQLTALGVRYFERGNEPNLVWEWQDGQWPSDWTDGVFRQLALDWLDDANLIVWAGGYPAIDACSPGGDYDDITYLTRFLQALRYVTDVQGAAADPLLWERTWLSVHNAGLNHPLDYPDDAVNQAEHPGQTIHTHYYADGSPTGASNCIRKWQAVHQLAADVAGLDLPVLCTEGGFWPGNRADTRYPELTEQAASDLQASVLRQMQTAPAYLLAQMPWLWFNRLGANPAEGFERDAWKRIPGWGNCPASEPAVQPIVQMLLDKPCKERTNVPTRTPEPTGQITVAEREQARQALATVPATMKAAAERGYVWLKELYQPGDAYALAIAYSTASRRYLVLKLDATTWQVIGEATL